MEKEEITQISTRLMASTGDELGLLGFGCMRFPKKGRRFDMEAVEQMLRHAIAAGVNYFDTAYMYGGSEEALGAVLAKAGPDGQRLREKVNIATKMPIMMIRTREAMDEKLAISLRRLQTDYVDYYLVHGISSLAQWDKLKQLGACEFLEKQRDEGKIRHIGFSWHGNLFEFRQVVDDYPWDFCQIQYNYVDEHTQAGTEGLQYAAQKGLGIVVMEPLRGGTLADKLPSKAAQLVSKHKDEQGRVRSAAYWGMRWVMEKPEVNVVLSGMNAMEQLTENIAAANDSTPGSLGAADAAMIQNIVAIYNENNRVPCTGCSYCMPCPSGVDIPTCLSYYNSKTVFGGASNDLRYLLYTGGKQPGRASQCEKCGACETKCPQHIPIMDTLADAAKTMEKPWLVAPAALVIKLMGR